MSDFSNKAVLTSKQIIDERRPILYVSHDHDGFWQFLSGFELDESDGRVVSMEEILQIDNTLSDLSWLPEGMEAKRTSTDEEWRTAVLNEE